ncbi:MAG: ABC-F family ATP-binding cassette domain-containing protein [Ruminococcus sp.]|jgi:ATP-binding cassette subfamily F protein 3|nr:ABC-F family ATP-binding cassette domain-containing protein [Ruminococcus sp.]
MILTIQNISKIYNGKTVLDNIDLQIEDTDRIGLVGINGSGKSTLLKILTGDETFENQPEPNIPVFSQNKNARIGILKQNSGLSGDLTVYEEAHNAFKFLTDVKLRLTELERMIASLEIHEDESKFTAISHEFSEKTNYFEVNGGYRIDVDIDIVLQGMGFPKNTYGRNVSTLSGGEKTRLALAKLLLSKPNLLILDEPTNHLDFETVIWLENFLKSYKGALLIVSHDRYFLDALTTSTCEIENARLTRYKGNYTRFTALKKEAVTRQLKEYEEQQKEIAELKDYVDRNIVRASTSAMAKSRLKMLERIVPIEKPILYHKDSIIRFEYDTEPPIDVLRVKNVTVSVGDPPKILADSVNLSVRRGEKIAVIGKNGTGKSTFLKMLVRKLQCKRGVIEWARNTKVSYFDQENSTLHPNLTVMDEIHSRYPTMTDLQVRSLLGAVRITGENVYKLVKVLSGGEKAKLSFALMTLTRGNVLVLDEPTNHLDIAVREVLEDALADFPGTIIFVSHDRYLLDKIATRVCEITPDGFTVIEGGFESYKEAIEARQEALRRQIDTLKTEKANVAAAEKKISTYKNKEQRAKEAAKRLRIKELESEIDTVETEITILENEITLPEIISDYEKLHEKCNRIDELKNLLNEITDEWLLLSEMTE